MLNPVVEEDTVTDIPLCSLEIGELPRNYTGLKIWKNQEADFGSNSAFWLHGFR